MRVLYLDCISGISGDMTVGALLDLGLDFERMRGELARLEMSDEFTVSVESVNRCGITATKFHVHTTVDEHHEHAHPDHEHHHHEDHEHGPHEHHHHEDHEHGPHQHHDHAHRSHADIVGIIQRANLSPRATETALRIFRRIAEAEAKIHGVPVETVHFHEVGAVDSIVDIVAAAVLLDFIGADRIVASPVPLGSGRVKTQHGLYPVPAPATLEIMRGKPIRQDAMETELATPTGAAIVATMADSFGALPSVSVEAIGYGAGSKNFPDRPNVVRAVLGQSAAGAPPVRTTGDIEAGTTAPGAGTTGPGNTQEHIDGNVMRIEVNLDDISGELLGHLVDRLFAAGANDVFYTPIYMKKNRPAFMLQVLCSEQLLAPMTELLFRETTTFGLRFEPCTVHRLAREWRPVETAWGPVRIKEGLHSGSVVQRSPEYEDCRRIADERGIPLKDVFDAARSAAHSANSPR